MGQTRQAARCDCLQQTLKIGAAVMCLVLSATQSGASRLVETGSEVFAPMHNSDQRPTAWRVGVGHLHASAILHELRAQQTHNIERATDGRAVSNVPVHGNIPVRDIIPVHGIVSRSVNNSCDAIMSACYADQACVTCRAALERWAFPPAFQGDNVYTAVFEENLTTGFWNAILATPQCNTSFAVVNPTLSEECSGSDFDKCQQAQFECMANSACAACTNDTLHYQPRTALNSSACRGVNTSLMFHGVALYCRTFPRCSFYKSHCNGTCAVILQTLAEGDVQGAAQLYMNDITSSGSNVYALLTSTLSFCMDGTVACNFWQAVCARTPTCNACLAAMNNASSAEATVHGIGTIACGALWNGSTPHALGQLFRVIDFCPTSMVPSCASAWAYCFLKHGPACAQCAEEASMTNQTECTIWMEGEDIPTQCASCPSSVNTINKLTIAIQVIGSVSLVVCLGVIIALLAYSRDLGGIRDRVILGLMTANAVYSSANTMPLTMLKTGPEDCGQRVLSFDTIRFGRAWWYGGKYGILCYEFLILASSVWALKWGQHALPRRSEAVLHVMCVVGGFAAFVGFYARCEAINNDGYNGRMQSAVQNNNFAYLSLDDDQNDDDPMVTASTTFSSASTEYNRLNQLMLQVWVAFLSVAILMWAYLRWTFRKLLAAWWAHLNEAQVKWDRDLWSESDQSERARKLRVLTLAKEGYEDIAQPLEPFVFIFVAFGVPAIVMATDYCVENSDANTQAGSSSFNNNSINYGPCMTGCELALAFRSMGTVVVYLWRKENRDELLAICTLWRRLRERVLGLVVPSRRRGVKFDTELQVRIMEPEVEG